MNKGFGRTGRVGPPVRPSLDWSLIRLPVLTASVGVQLRSTLACLPYYKGSILVTG